jgi:hypothetical protein
MADPDRQKQLVFNYRTRFNEAWDDALLKDAYSYATEYPEQDSGILGLTSLSSNDGTSKARGRATEGGIATDNELVK